MPKFLALELLRAMRSDVRADWKTPFKTLYFVVSHPFLAWRWTSYLLHDPMPSLWRTEPRLIDKPLRPYLNARWSVPERLGALQNHYCWLSSKWTAEALKQLHETGPAVLARWPLSAGSEQVSLVLGHCGSFEREGDLTLSLRIAGTNPDSTRDDTALVSLTFGVARVGGVASLCIGCVQARKDDHTREQLAHLTRGQHGMRPKALLLHIARALARRWGLELYGIDPTSHPFASLRYQMSRSKRSLLKSMRESYVQLWHDAQGQLQENGWWRLPTGLPARAAQDIPTRKRAMYARREQWLAALDQDIGARLSQLEAA